MPDSLGLPEITETTVTGFIEVMNESGIYGWAFDRERPDRATALLLFIDDTLVAEVPCAAYRPDVERSGYGCANAGFYAGIPREYFDGQPHRYFFANLARQPVCLNALSGAPEIERTFCYTTYFDYPFYKLNYEAAQHMGRQDAFQHWRSALGTKDERFANEEAFVASLEKNGQRLPGDFSAILYRFLTGAAEGAGTRSTEAVAQFLRQKEEAPAAEAAKPLDAMSAHDERVYAAFKQFLRAHGILSDQFLRYLSVPDYIAANPGVGLRTPMQCVQHFVTIGRAELAGLSFEHGFDYAFLAEYDPNFAALAPVQAYLRWLNQEMDEALPPNRLLYLSGLLLRDVEEFPEGFDAGMYFARNPELKSKLHSRWAALAHYINTGAAESRLGCELTPQSADIHRAAADRMAVAGQLQAARKLYERVLEQCAADVTALRHYGDCLLRLEEFSLASAVYERTIAAGADNLWTHLNLSSCMAKQERWAASVLVLQLYCERHPENMYLWERYEHAMRDAFEALAREASWRAEQGFYDAGRAKMREACAVLTGPFKLLGQTPNRARRKVKHLAIVADMGLAQCNFYRVQQKREHAELAGITCKIFNYTSEIAAFEAAIPGLDAVIFYRVPATPDTMGAIFRARKAGLPAFYEIDDLMFDETLFPDRFESYGGQIAHGLYATLINGPAALRAAMAVCDYAIASTPALARAMQPLVLAKKSFVHRNALGTLHEAACAAPRFARAADRVRIFYGSGTTAHNDDFALHLAPQLAKLLQKWGATIELYIVGYLTLPPCLGPYIAQITLAPPNWDLQAYWRTLAEMDINLAVLKPGLLSDCKSEIKWLEAAMLGLPSVVSATGTYREVITQERTGILVRNDAEWFSALDMLVADVPLREKIGAAARKSALKDYAPATMSAALTAMLDQVTLPPSRKKRKKILLAHVFFDPQLTGGATRVVMDNLRDLLATSGDQFEFEIFTTIEGASAPYQNITYMWENVRVNAVTTPSVPGLEQRVWDPAMGLAFTAVLERFKPELVHFHCVQRITLSAAEAARKRGIPYIITAHDGWWLSDEQFLVDDYGTEEIYDFAHPMREFKQGGSEKLERLRAKQICLNAASAILAVSEPFAEIYRKQGFANVTVVENGVSALQDVKRSTAPDARVRLAHVGGARPHKGYHLVRAALTAGQFENLQLLVIDHEMDAAATRKTQWGATPVTLRGKFPQHEVGELYAETDVLLAPSVWPESYGLVAREAALAGCWVVASDRGAIGQDVTAENGFVVDVSSAAGLAGAFAAINADPARYQRSPKLSTNPRKARAQAEELAALYRKFIG